MLLTIELDAEKDERGKLFFPYRAVEAHNLTVRRMGITFNYMGLHGQTLSQSYTYRNMFRVWINGRDDVEPATAINSLIRGVREKERGQKWNY